MSKIVLMDIDSVGIGGILGYEVLNVEDNLVLLSTKPLTIKIETALKLKQCKANINSLEFENSNIKTNFISSMIDSNRSNSLILVTNDMIKTSQEVTIIRDTLLILNRELELISQNVEKSILDIYELSTNRFSKSKDKIEYLNKYNRG